MSGTAPADQFGLKDYWKSLSAVLLVSVASFQYGLDFGVIGGLQAMVGFLKVCTTQKQFISFTPSFPSLILPNNKR